MISIIQDLRFGVRMLLKNPAFTLIGIVTLALGIGANTAIFSVINSVLLRPLPYDQSDRLVLMNERNQQMDGMSISWPNYTDWRNQNTVLDGIAVFNRGNYNLTGVGEPEQLRAGQVTANLFHVLRVKPMMGRVFTEDEDKPGGAPVVILSYGTWQQRFGADANIINRTISLNDKTYTVIGVMPDGFRFPSRIEIWVPVGQLSDAPGWQQRGNHPGLYGVARLKDGVTIEQARAAMDSIAAGLEQRYPDSNAGNRVRMIPLLENYVGDIHDRLWTLFGAVGFVLLIACANVANLTLARATMRQKELAVRAALGAGRWRIVRQLITESVLLSVLGGISAIFVASWGLSLILKVNPNGIPRAQEIGLDSRVLIFTLAVSIVTGIIFGLIPAWQSSKVDVHETLKDAGRGNSGRRQLLRSSLVVTEIAAALMLLVGAGLLIRSFYRLHQVNPGFNYDRLLSASVALPDKKYNEPQRINFYDNLLTNLQNIPGVDSAAISSGLPLGNNGNQTSFVIDGRPVPQRSDIPLMEISRVTPDYFKAMGIPIKAGRVFTKEDNKQHLVGQDLSKLSAEDRMGQGINVIVIDEDFAKKYWPNEDPIGKYVLLGDGTHSPKIRVIGVVGRVRMEELKSNNGFVQAYFSYYQVPSNSMTLVVKSSLTPAALIDAVRQQVRSLDPNQPIYNIRTMEQIRDESITNEKFNLTLWGLFACIALVLALVGVYGVMNYAVTQRTQEIGIRVALGAQQRDVLSLIMGQGMKLAMLGIIGGLVGAWLLSRLMKGMLFGVSNTDPLTFGLIAALLVMVALLACWIPARRATKVDPLIAIRYE